MASNLTRCCKMQLFYDSKYLRFSNTFYRILRRRLKFNLRYYCSEPKEVQVELFNGKTVRLSTGKYARFADGSAVVSLGDTAVMATVVSKSRASSAASFVPLTVDYRQKAAALGRIPTNFLRRELGPTDTETLTSRVIDRSLRPLFPQGYNGDTQIICSPLALDGINNPDVLAINAASAALAVSDIPWNGPVGAVRVASCNNELLVNPTKRELAQSSLNLIVTATRRNLVVMLEGSADNILLPDIQHAIKFAVKECQVIVNNITQLAKDVGKSKREFSPFDIPADAFDTVRSLSEMRLREIFTDQAHDKISRDNAVTALRTDVLNKISNSNFETHLLIEAFNRVSKEVFRNLIFERQLRCDGRAMTELRPISCAVGLYQPLHGSALFQRGQTQVLCTLALDSPNSAMKMDAVSVITSGLKEKNFFVHYEFPPYATNEITRSSNRREIGHGALAERGLRAIVPPNCPFTLRLAAEVLESNGSSSMAAVCGGSMALMDAGIAVQGGHAAGVAIGLVTRTNGNQEEAEDDYLLLTDLLGIEDYAGDMDFKVAGTKKGITAIQADIKLAGISLKIVMEALQAATEAKSKIINIMNDTIRAPRSDRKDNMPVMEKLQVPVHKRAKFIGLGGVNLRRLEMDTGVQVIQEEDGDFVLFAPNSTAFDEAKEVIDKLLVSENAPTLEFGEIYTAKIVEVRDIGCMVILYPEMTPVLLHNSQLDQRKISHPSALGLEVGQELKVKYFGRDPVSGVMRLSRKVLQGTPSGLQRNFNE